MDNSIRHYQSVSSGVVIKYVTINARGFASIPVPVKLNTVSPKCLLLLRCFLGAMLSRRYAAEMALSFVTRFKVITYNEDLIFVFSSTYTNT